MEALGLVPTRRRGGRPGHRGVDGPPDPAAAGVYAQLLPVFADLYAALVPTFTALRRLAPALPLELDGDTRG